MRQILILSLLLLVNNYFGYARKISKKSSIRPTFWQNCKDSVCDEIEDQAQGLVRLKLMKKYITETMSLLNQLVESMDAELVESGMELTEFIGPNCPEVHPLLEQIKKHSMGNHQDFRETGLSSAMTTGVDQYEQDDSKEYYGNHSGSISGNTIQNAGSNKNVPGIYGTHNTGTGGYVAPSNPARYDTNHQSKEDLDDHDNSEEKLDQSYISATSTKSRYHHNGKRPKSFDTNGHRYGKSHTVTTSNGQTSSYGATSNGYVSSYGTPPNGHTSSHGTTSNGQTSPYFTTTSGHPSSFSTSSGGNSHNQSSGSGQGTKTDLQSSGSIPNRVVIKPSSNNCKGVDRRSPFWVPGIDSWCRQNCAAGYCPETHCIC